MAYLLRWSSVPSKCRLRLTPGSKSMAAWSTTSRIRQKCMECLTGAEDQPGAGRERIMSVQFGRWHFEGRTPAPDCIEKVSATLAPYGPDSNESYSEGGVNV